MTNNAYNLQWRQAIRNSIANERKRQQQQQQQQQNYNNNLRLALALSKLNMNAQTRNRNKKKLPTTTTGRPPANRIPNASATEAIFRVPNRLPAKLWKVVQIKNDGNCFFRAIAAGLKRHGFDVDHVRLRRLAMEELDIMLEPLNQNTKNAVASNRYKQQMKQCQVWAEGPVIDAMQRVLQHRFHVAGFAVFHTHVDPNNGRVTFVKWIGPPTTLHPPTRTNRMKPTIYLHYINNTHYELLVPQ